MSLTSNPSKFWAERQASRAPSTWITTSGDASAILPAISARKAASSNTPSAVTCAQENDFMFPVKPGSYQNSGFPYDGYGYMQDPSIVIEAALIFNLKASVMHNRVVLGLNCFNL